MRKFLIVTASTVALAGCSVYMAADSEGKKDLDVLACGNERDNVLVELGTPAASVDEDGARYDLFSFLYERSAGSNAGRAVAYGAAAVLTLGLSEVITTPLEAGVGDAGEIKLRVYYDEQKRVTWSEVYDGEKWAPLSTYRAQGAVQRKPVVE